jgi:antitoxin VapB
MPRPPRKPSTTIRGRSERPADTATVTEARLFMTGRSQAVRLPAAYRFVGDSVYVKRWRGVVILLPKRKPWTPLVESLGKFTSDFLNDRAEPGPQQRPDLDGLFD